MIKNNHQYYITKTQIELFEDALIQCSENPCPADISPIIYQAQKEGIESQLNSLRNEIEEYERLRSQTYLNFQKPASMI